MLSAYQAPGVYHQRVDAGAPKISAIRTDVAGFVGIAERGPLDEAVVVESWKQFQGHFGSFIPGGYLAYSVHAFFMNGGRRCWIVRVADREGAQPASAEVFTAPPGGGTPGPAWRIEASTVGGWGDSLSFELMELRKAEARVTGYEDGQELSIVTGTGGFERRSLVRVGQVGGPTETRVVSGVDHVGSRLIWFNEDPRLRLASDRILTGLDGARPIFVESLQYRLVIRSSGRVIATYDDLSRVPGHERYAPTALESPYREADPERERDEDRVPEAPPFVRIVDLEEDELAARVPDPLSAPVTGALTGGVDGLATLRADDFIGSPVHPEDSDLVRRARLRGLEVLRTNREVCALAIPDIHIRPDRVRIAAPPVPCIPDPCLLDPPPASPVVPVRPPPELPPVFGEEDVFRVQQAMVLQAESALDRVAILDAPADLADSLEEGLPGIDGWRGRFDSKYAALYFPWIRVPHPAGTADAIVRDIPPSGHVAGRFAGVDYEVGVHKAPANTRLLWTLDTTLAIDTPVAGLLNPRGINAIRTFPGRGVRIYGARLISSDPDWRFLNVRRLVLMIRKGLEYSTQWAAFEPNDHFTRAKIHLALTSFLNALWQQGALVGDAPDEAFRVRCDEVNNPPHDRDNGRLFADVSIAPSRPLEFVVIRVSRHESVFDVAEQ